MARYKGVVQVDADLNVSEDQTYYVDAVDILDAYDRIHEKAVKRNAGRRPTPKEIWVKSVSDAPRENAA